MAVVEVEVVNPSFVTVEAVPVPVVSLTRSYFARLVASIRTS